MLLSPEVLAILILNSIFFIFGLIALILSINIFTKWDINSTTPTQYNLEKNSFLTSTIIKYIFIIKLPLFLFFIFTLDKISGSITGAMCAAGIVDATPYGIYLLILKIINIYLFGSWLILHYLDSKYENLPFTKQKFAFFIVAFIFLSIEISLEFLMFNSLNVDKIVSCCGTLFSTTSSSYISNIFLIDKTALLLLFYGSFFMMLLFNFLKNKYLFALTNFLFLIISILALISLFGTYIYELPTHHCPFCFLQGDYNYIGYFIYTFLFMGTFFGLNTLIKNDKKYYKISLISNLIFIIIVSYYPLSYYINNGVWL